MKAYWFDNLEVYLGAFHVELGQDHVNTSQGDQREDHNSGNAVDSKYLSDIGVLYYHCPSITDVDAIASNRSYKNRDEIIVSPEKMGFVGGSHTSTSEASIYPLLSCINASL